MKHIRRFLMVTLLLMASFAWAYDFEADGIYYDITSHVAPYEVSVAYNNYYTGNIVIPETVVFQGITYSVTSIGNRTFYECWYLTSVTIPNSVTNIGEYAFAYCPALTSVNIPNSVTGIGEGAFRGCTSLTSVIIGNLLTIISENTFYNCTSLTSITIGNSVTSIGNAAFSGCEGLTSVTIPNSVTSIGDAAFSGCTGLTSVSIGNSVTSIGNLAFSSCTGLTSVIIPNSVTSIGFDAFASCRGLTSVTIGNSVTIIKASAFYDCAGLTSVTIGNSVAIIDRSAFRGCTSLTSVNIPNSVTSIGDYAFYGCTDLSSVTIGDSVTRIGDYAYYDCSSLALVTIPGSVTRIGEAAFYDCTGLTSVTVEATTPPSTGSNAFPSQAMQLFVPCGCTKAYQNDLDWGSCFFSIIDTVFPFTLETVSNDANLGSASIVQFPSCENYFAIVQAEPIGGYFFLGWMIDSVMVSTANPYTFVVNEDMELVAYFSGVGIEENAQLVSVSPNPANNWIKINCEEMQNVSLFFLDGRMIKVINVMGANEMEMDLSGLSKGLYMLRIETCEGKTINHKIIVQ